MHFNLLTLFPEMFPASLAHSLAGKALRDGLWGYQTLQIRDFATDKHRTVDDTPFGGGAGMVMRADVLDAALSSLPKPGRKIYFSPRGKVLNQSLVEELAQSNCLTLLCGRYEGIDQRVIDAHALEEVSIGDYILSGGEMAALVLMDAIIRLLGGAIGNHATHDEESFANGLLEYPHYTRPAIWTDSHGIERPVPEALMSGHHGNIAAWRHAQSQEITRLRRPDLWQAYLNKKGLE